MYLEANGANGVHWQQHLNRRIQLEFICLNITLKQHTLKLIFGAAASCPKVNASDGGAGSGTLKDILKGSGACSSIPQWSLAYPAFRRNFLRTKPVSIRDVKFVTNNDCAKEVASVDVSVTVQCGQLARL
jgi:hypothetical protein